MKLLSRCLLLVIFSLPATSKLHGQAIVGAWSFGNTASPDADGTGLLVFLANGAYFHLESENTDPNGMNGMERGTYTWHAGTGAFTATNAMDTNGQWGLNPDTPTTITISGDTMDIDGFSLSRVTGASPIVGAWTFGNTLTPGSTGTGVVVFLANNVYFHAESENSDPNGMNGMERGTYTWNLMTGAFTAANAVDTNGQWGLNPDTPPTITISGDTMDIEGFGLSRVSAVPEPSTYAACAGLAVLSLACWRRRRKA